MRKRPAMQAQQGVSLLGLLVGLMVVAIITAVAVPSYQQHVAKARRNTGQSALLVLAQHMQRVYSDNGTYAPAGSAPDLPLDIVPVTDALAYYEISWTSIASQSYVLRATPKDVQAGDGFLEVTHTGQRRWDADNSGAISASERGW